MALSLDEGMDGEVVDVNQDVDDLRRAQSKTERALERLRRAVVKLLDATLSGRGNAKGKEVGMDIVKELLVEIVCIYEGFVQVSLCVFIYLFLINW